MWLYGSGMLLNCGFNQLFPGWLDMKQSPDLEGCLNTITPWEIPISLYVVPRLLQAVITSACMVAIYVLAKRLLGQAVALAAIILLILEPFFLGYQRLLTTDALQTDLSALGLLLFLLYLRGSSDRRSLIISGVLMGLAIATKIPTLFVLPAVFAWIVLIELALWRTNFHPRGWKRQIIDLCLWLMTIGTVIYAIWPAMWVAPLETLTKLQGGLSEEADIGNLFFLGQVTDSPGLVFYPLVLAYRLSPAVQVGLLVCLVILLLPKLRRSCKKTPELIALVLVPLCVLVFLSSINRKYDRYLLLAYPELVLLAGAGWISILVWVKRNRKIQQLLQPWIGHTRGRTTKGVKRGILMVGLQILVLVPFGEKIHTPHNKTKKARQIYISISY
jgi:4-amino-4-deoxy-L-arabinose transferase-like glycosyltransferase